MSIHKHFSHCCNRLVLFLPIIFSACSEKTNLQEDCCLTDAAVNSEQTDGSDTIGPDMCHLDCPGGPSEYKCQRGQAWVKGTYQGGGTVPCGTDCSYWEDNHACSRGCRTDGFDSVYSTCVNHCGPVGVGCCAYFLCEESKPKDAGDPCRTDADCTWYDETGKLHDTELVCNTADGVCEER